MSWLRPRQFSGSSAAPKTMARFSQQFKASPRRPRGGLADVHARYSCGRKFAYVSCTLWCACFVQQSAYVPDHCIPLDEHLFIRPFLEYMHV